MSDLKPVIIERTAASLLRLVTHLHTDESVSEASFYPAACTRSSYRLYTRGEAQFF